MRKTRVAAAGGATLLLAALGTVSAWWAGGHETITAAAADRLPDDVPAFFRRGGKHLAHFSNDPDRWKNPDAPFLTAAEGGNHFLNVELFAGKPYPGTNRIEGMKLVYVELKKDPTIAGALPYAIVEYYERLLLAFADHRKSPANESIHMKCLVYGGTLAHYTADAAMPLHVTADFDGRKQGEGIKQRGIHARIDSFPEKNGITPDEVCRTLKPVTVANVWEHVNKFIAESNACVDKCYELDARGAFEHPTNESREFILGRCRAGAQLTLDLWYTAWKKSEGVRVGNKVPERP